MNYPLVVFISTFQLALGFDKVLWKCCLKDEELHSNGRDCMVRSVGRSKLLTIPDTGLDANILPAPFNITGIRVKDADTSNCTFNNFLLLDTNETNRFEVLENMILKVKFTNFSGQSFSKSFNIYCLDSIQDKNDSFIIRICTSDMTHAKKCCPAEKVLQKNTEGDIECKNSTNSWNMSKSLFKNNLNVNAVTDILYNALSLCADNFDVIPHQEEKTYLNRSSSMHLFKNSGFSKFPKYEFVCVDFYQENGKAIERIGRCYHNDEYLLSFFKVHHLCLPAALLLLLSIAAIMIRVELRHSLHGQALACHAASLLIASFLRAMWWYSEWYKPKNISQCNVLASILNYFMVASAIWLNIICINTFIEIRNSQQCGKKQSPRTIIWYSIYGWVVPALHTLLVVLHGRQINHDSSRKTHIFHTRTCFFKDDSTNHRKTETFLFYYGPMTVILLVNIVLLIYSIAKCQRLQNTVTAMLGGERKLRPLSSRTVPEQALMYARLLISTGVGEMAAEVTAWALSAPLHGGAGGSRLAEKALLRREGSEKEIMFWIMATAFDFLRALSVFALCFVSRGTLRALRDHCKGYGRLGRRPTPPNFKFLYRNSPSSDAQDNISMFRSH